MEFHDDVHDANNYAARPGPTAITSLLTCSNIHPPSTDEIGSASQLLHLHSVAVRMSSQLTCIAHRPAAATDAGAIAD